VVCGGLFKAAARNLRRFLNGVTQLRARNNSEKLEYCTSMLSVRIHRRNPSMSPWIRRRIFHRTKIIQRSRLYEFRFRTQRFAIRDIIHLIYAAQIFWHLRKAFDFYRHRTRCTSLYKKTDVESKNISANIVINVSTLMVFSTDKLCKSRIKYSICVLGNIHYRAKVWDH